MQNPKGINDILSRITRMRKKVTTLIEKKDYENALLLISCMAEILYKYNQSYTDFDLEDKLQLIQRDISLTGKKHHAMPSSCKTIIFYDGFGLDLRGLAFIYLSALVKMNCRLVYIVRTKRRDKIPTITSLLKKHGAKIIYIPRLSLTDEYRYLVKVMEEYKPSAGFMYTTPNDVSGIMAFMAGKNKYIRYQINLTDHAFWLGCNAFDFSIEFRDYGASISHYYRNIPKEKIIKLPYYPYIDKSKDFEGYPFSVSENDLIIFSGGSLYKTFDGKGNLYYKIIDFCLHNYKQVKFWYAGSGDDSELVKLMRKYPNRVFRTDERNDLFQIMLNIDIYISTYPMNGGLMSQYSAIAGIVPLTLRSGEETGGILNSDIVSYEFDNLEDFKYELQHLLSDKAYRINQGKKLKESIMSKHVFDEVLKQIIRENYSPFEISYWKPDVKNLMETYRKNFNKIEFEKIIAKPAYFGLFKFFPEMFTSGLIVRGGGIMCRIISRLA